MDKKEIIKILDNILNQEQITNNDREQLLYARNELASSQSKDEIIPSILRLIEIITNVSTLIEKF
jgi:hypothetical protein